MTFRSHIQISDDNILQPTTYDVIELSNELLGFLLEQVDAILERKTKY